MAWFPGPGPHSTGEYLLATFFLLIPFSLLLLAAPSNLGNPFLVAAYLLLWAVFLWSLRAAGEEDAEDAEDAREREADKKR